ncbi:MAG: hypothetical protein AABZ44_09705 [Elusimicrobiota bacterium]
MKKDKNKNKAPLSLQPSRPLLSALQWQGLVAGALIVIAGFVVLSNADAAAANWAGKLAPFLIIGGYGVVALSLWLD